MTCVAVHAHKAISNDPAVKERSQFLFDEPGHRAIALALAREECLQLLRDDTIQQALFGIAGYIWLNAFTSDEDRTSRHEWAIAW